MTWLSVVLAVADDAPHSATLVYVLTGVCSFFAAIIAILAGFVWSRVKRRPEEVAAAALAADEALGARISAFSTQLDSHGKEAKQSASHVLNAVNVVSRDVAVVSQRVEDLVERIDDMDDSHRGTQHEVTRNREQLLVLHSAVLSNRARQQELHAVVDPEWSDEYTPLPGPLPQMPPQPPRRRRTAPPAPRKAWGNMKAPGATPADRAAPLPDPDDDNER